MAGRGASRVPERWTDYTPLGRRMPGTRFVAFKVPLTKSFDHNLLPEERFSPHDLIRKVREQKEELGLIIDLTYTTRYYGPEELPPTLCYSKILTMGREIPNRQTFVRFRYIVKKFLNDNKNNDKLIGVHCTHGLNRTGYLVCRYLIDVEGMEPNAAIELFNKSRGHPIERPNYIQDLQKRALKRSCELKSLGSDLVRKKSSATAKPQKHPQHAPAAPRNHSNAKKKHWAGSRAQAQELGHRHGALGWKKPGQKQQRQLEEKQQLEQQKKKLEQKKVEQKQQKLELEQNQQRQQKLEQKELKQKQQQKVEQRQLEEKKLDKKQQQKVEQKQKKKLEQRQQQKVEQKQQRQLEEKQLDQQKLEQRQQQKLEQRQQQKLEQRQQQKLEQRQQQQRQPCTFPPRNCWVSPPPKKQHKGLFPPQSPQPCPPQEPPARRKRRKRERAEQGTC